MNEASVLIKIMNGLSKRMYWPICRGYARHLGDKPADGLYRLLCSLQFRRVNGFWPNFVHPKRFSEKIWSRMLFGRDPIYTLISDKLLVRDYVAAKVGRDILIPLIWSGDNPENIPFDELPTRFVIKTNHGCGYNILVHDKRELDYTRTKHKLKKWLGKNYCQDYCIGTAWGYKNIKPALLIETFIGEGQKPPVDYKFMCFSGRVEFLTMHFDRFEEQKMVAVDINFKPYDFGIGRHHWSGECAPPANFEKMVQIAECLANGFDQMRIDLYNVNGKIYFGEMTPYPGGAEQRFLPPSRDVILGKIWKAK